MLGRLATVVALLAALLLSATPSTAAVSAEPYGPIIPTDTHIRVLESQNGEPVIVEFWTTSNSRRQPKGTLEIAIAPQSSGAVGGRVAPATFTKTVQFEGKRVRVEGPVLSPGRYLVTADFTPDNPELFLPSSNSKVFSVKAGGDNGGDGDDDNSGGLPNTGGPDLWLLLLGLGLVGAGSAAVVQARRRGATPAAA